MNTKIIIIAGVVLGIVLVGSLVTKQKETPLSLDSQINSEGAVEVEVTPLEISNASDLWQFKIVLNTHSVELGQDLAAVVELFDDKGNAYQPLSWEGAPPGGHHREGVLSFRPLAPRPSSILLVINNIGEVPERKFVWGVK